MHDRVLILDQERIQRKLRRMAFQIWEHNSLETSVALLGIAGSGMVVARKLSSLLMEISPLDVSIFPLIIQKKNPIEQPLLDAGSLNGQSLILVDDVVNTGRTLLYAMRPLLQCTPKRILTAVLVDRKHKSFPIASDIIGHSVATTIQDHIEVITEGDEIIAAYLQ